MLVSVNETSPHDNAAVWLHCVSQHIGSVCMSAVVVARSRLSLAVSLHEKTTEVRYDRVNFLSLCFPPFCYFRFEWVGSLQSSYDHRRGEVDREVGFYAIFSQYVCNHLHLVDIFP